MSKQVNVSMQTCKCIKRKTKIYVDFFILFPFVFNPSDPISFFLLAPELERNASKWNIHIVVVFNPLDISHPDCFKEWIDSNLRWNTSEYGGVADLRIPPSRLWKPDILMYNRYAIRSQVFHFSFSSCLYSRLNYSYLRMKSR